MLSYIMLCGAVIFMAVMFSAIFRRKFEQTIPLAVIFLTLMVYASGLLKLAKIGIYAAMIISLICMLFALFISIGQGNGMQLIRNLFTVGFVIFVIMAVVIFIASKNMPLAETDTSSKVSELVWSLVNGGSFADTPISKDSGIAFQPGYAVFVYMFTSFKGIYSEPDIIRGAGIFALSMILPVFSKIEWKSAYLAAGAAALIAGALYVGKTQVPVYGYADPNTATVLVFAMMLVTYMCCEQCGYVYWTLGLGNAMLCLIRPGSELLVLLLFLMILFDTAALGFWEVGELFATASKWISVIFYFLITVLVYLSWWIYSGRHGLGRLFDCINMTKERSLGFSGRLGQVFRAFSEGNAIIPFILWIIVIAAFGAGAALLSEGFWNKIRTGIQMSIVIIGLFIFLFVLAFAYTYIFSVSTNIKGTAGTFIMGYIVCGLILAVNMFIGRITDRFFTA